MRKLAWVSFEWYVIWIPVSCLLNVLTGV